MEYKHEGLKTIEKKTLKIIDLFCGGGGASMGIHQALEEANVKHKIIGIDVREMPDYPFEFIQSDVFKVNLTDFDDIADELIYWASPPCQMFSSLNNMNRVMGRTSDWVNLIPQTREMLLKTKKPFVIENVNQAPIRRDLMLCGNMFGLKTYRHRHFEIHGFKVYQPKHVDHKIKIGLGFFAIHRGVGFVRERERKKMPNYNRGSYKDFCDAMEIHWITAPTTKELPKGHPLTEAIPPAYSRYILNEFLKRWITLENFT